jgi:alpha-tubulin suppressor-like RCC1 family protein
MKKNMFIVTFILSFILTTLAQATPIENEAVQIAAGKDHSLALKKDGSVWAWGENGCGQLGDGSFANKTSPVRVAGLSHVTMIAAGHYHSLAIKDDGSVWAWGGNSSGQLGDETTTNKSSPVQVSGLSQVTRIAGFSSHSLALKDDGSVWAWGSNYYSQLGDGTTINKSSPVQVSGLLHVTMIAAGYYHNLVLKDDCSVWAWGENSKGQLGDKTTTQKSRPVQVSGLSHITMIAAGSSHSLALKDDGSVWAWGYNNYGQLGDKTTKQKISPVQLSGLSHVAKVAAGYSYSLALKDDGSAWAWGYNNYGQLGDGTTTNKSSPVQVSGLSYVTMIATGFFYSLALKDDGSIWAWGKNSEGQLGDGTATKKKSPVQVSGLSHITMIASGDYHNLVLKDDGSVWAWGYNYHGQLGDGTTTQKSSPVQISGLSHVTMIAAGDYYSLALKDDCSVWAWGHNHYGQLGDGTTTQKSNPVQLYGLSHVTVIAAGYYHSLALKDDSSVWAWGYNGNGQLGDGTTTQKNTPVQVYGLSDVTMIAAGYYHSLALKDDGSVWAWGYNGNGQLGDGTTTQKSTPVQVYGLSDVTMIAAGDYHSLALKDDGSAWAWGHNYHGQLGNGTTTQKSTPTQVTGLSDVTMIATGDYHVMAIKDDSSVWAWGRNNYDQLGDGTTTQKRSPVQVSGLSHVTMIAAGSYHSLAIKVDGSAWAWGQNCPEYGQLGYGSPTHLPEQVYSDIQIHQKTFSTSPNSTITIPVFNSAQKSIIVSFTTIDDSAVSGIDYIHTSGNLTFQANESQKEISITILNNPKNQTEKTFVLNIGASNDIFLNDGSQAIITISSGKSVNAPYSQTFTQNMPAYGWTYYSSETTGRIQQTADSLRMDSSIDNSTSLNEAILHIDLLSADDIQLNFFQKAIIRDTCTSLPSNYTDHFNGDGISISNDGYTWYRILDCDVLMTDSQGNNYTIDVDAEIERIQTNHEPNFFMTANTQIKFQQYGNRTYPSGGREWDNVTINASYNTTMTITIHYFGSQTGTLHVTLFDQNTGRQTVAPVSYTWNIDTKKQDFIARVPSGNYTITAFIDTDETGEINAWEAHASYLIPVTFDENLNIYNTITIYDPKDQYSPQFIQHTGTYKAWFNNYPTIGQPDEDFDMDGYTNFQEYLNGTNPEITDLAYQYNGYDPAFDQDDSDITHQYQVISTNPLIAKARPGDAFLVDVNYTTSDKNSETTGLGLAIHFNSAFMEFAGFSNVLTESLAGNFQNLTTAEILKDESDENVPNDGFEDTDKVIIIGWVDDLGEPNWPGTDVKLPVCLCTLKFNVKSEAQGITFTDRSVIRFSSTSKDTRYQFYAPPTTVALEPFNFDIDGDGQVNALTDGILIVRYLFGLIVYNDTIHSDLIDPEAIRTTNSDIWTYLNSGYGMLDIDGNNTSDSLTDGLLILRYMFGIEGDALIENAISIDASRNTADEVIPYIKQYLPQKASPLLSATVQTPEYQEIILSPSNNSPSMGSTFDLSVMYNVSDNDNTLPGLGIRIHYDSTKFDYMGVANMQNSAIASPYETPETPQYSDNDPNTDRMIIMGWVDIMNNNWPNQSLPCKIADVLFKVKQIPECSTSINAEFTAAPAGYYGKAQHADIHIAQGPPSITITGEWEILEDTAGDVLFQITDPDTDLSDLSISVASFCPDLLETMDFQFTSQTTQQRIRISPALNQYGSCPISITVCDQTYTVNESFMLSIISVDDPPTLSPISDHTIYGKPLYAEVHFSVNDIDSPSDDFSFDFSSSNQIILPKDHINMIDDDTTKTLQIMPTTNEVGSVTVNVSVFSGTLSTTRSFLLSFNQAPVATETTCYIDEDKNTFVHLKAKDIENDPLSYTIISETEHGEITIDGDIVNYKPSANYHGMDRFSFKTSDGFSDSNIAHIILTVLPIDDPPIAENLSFQTKENKECPMTFPGTDVDGEKLTVNISQPEHGHITQQWTYLPDEWFYGTDTFSYSLSDNKTTVTATITITVNRADEYPLTITKTTDIGEIIINKQSINHLPWQGTYATNSSVTLEAISTPNLVFERWIQDSLSITENPLTITMDTRKNISPYFVPPRHKLTLLGYNYNSVIIDGDTYTLPVEKIFNQGSLISIEAIPHDMFIGFSGDCIDNNNPIALNLQSDMTIGVIFKDPQEWSMSVIAETVDLPQTYTDEIRIGVSLLSALQDDQLSILYGCSLWIYSPDWQKFSQYIQPSQLSEYSWIIAVNPHGNIGSPDPRTSIIRWNPEKLSEQGCYRMYSGHDKTGEIVVSDMRNINEYEVTGGETVQTFTIVWSEQFIETFHLFTNLGWNLISLPVKPINNDAKILFPNSTLYEFKDNTYIPAEKLIVGKGYWLNATQKNYAITGESVESHTFKLHSGWNLIGALKNQMSNPLSEDCVEKILSYEKNSYTETSEVVPGKGYFLKIIGSDQANFLK